MEETDFHARIPSIAELCCVVVEIDLTETQDSSAKSHFHWKTFKCRLILDIMRDSVIACPVYETLRSIHVIARLEFFKSQLFHENLRDLNLTWSSPRPVTPDVYGNCLRYSILFAIAPRWNRVGQYLIAGKYFLTQTYETRDTNRAVIFRLNVQTTNKMETNAIVKIQPLNIRQCALSLEDIGIPRELIAHFMADKIGKIDVTSFGCPRVIVLPSLKRGRLTAVFKTIPTGSPFNNYGELRRHWKNMYGYRLPETDAGMIYYEVFFMLPEPRSFLYPHVCVRSRLIDVPYLGDRESLSRSFLADVSETIPTICGRPLKIVRKGDEDAKVVCKIDAISQENAELEKTPDKFPTIHGKPDETTRLSFSARYSPKNRQQLRRDLSSLMSPTPSQRGSVSRDKLAANRLRGILASSAASGRVFDAKSSTIKADRPDNQNCCPNGAGIEEEKSVATEAKHRIGSPIPNFASSSQDAGEIAPIIALPKCHQESVCGVEERNCVMSKYFETQSRSNEATSQLTIEDSKVSNTRRKPTLLEKLQRNIKAKDETINLD